MHTPSTIREIILSDHGIAISIRGVSDLIAEYAQLTPGDRLCMFISQKCDNSSVMCYSDDMYTVVLRKYVDKLSGVGFVSISCFYRNDQEWSYPFGRESWSADHTMERLKKAKDYPILRKLYCAVMQQDP